MAAAVYIPFDQSGNLVTALLCPEQTVVKFQGQRAAIDDLAQVRPGQAFYDGNRSGQPGKKAGCVIGRKWLPPAAAVRRSRQVAAVPKILHCSNGSSIDPAATFDAQSFYSFCQTIQ